MTIQVIDLLRRGLQAQSGGDTDGARRAYGAALELDAGNADAHNLLGVLLFRSGEQEVGLGHLRRAIELRPLVPGYQMNLGNALLESGQVAAARNVLQKALVLAPGDAEINYNLGRALLREGQRDAGEARFRKAVENRPEGYPDALSELASLLAHDGRVDEAEVYFRHAVTTGGDSTLIRQMLSLPPVPDSVPHIRQSRATFSSRVAAFSRKGATVSDPLREIGRTPFYLSFQGEPNRELLSAFAQTCLDACPQLAWTAPHCEQPRQSRERLRVGVISRFMREHDTGRTVAALLERLNPEKFEAIALFVPPFADGAVSSRIRRAAQQSVILPDDLGRARDTIAALELDVLLFTDVTVEPFTYFLSFARLARVQCVSCLHPDTSGVPNVDYFISSALFEPDNAREHYSERLYLISDAAMPFFFPRPPAMPGEVLRATVGLPSEANVYLCPHEPSGIHPEFDQILGAILSRDPAGIVALIQPEISHHSRLLRERFEKSFGEAATRVKFLPPRSREAFLLLLGAADVMLDPPSINNLCLSLDAFAAGLPVVTMPGALMRERQTAALYRRIGYEECVAGDAEAYVGIATGLTGDPSRRAAVSQQIRNRCGVLFEDPGAVGEIEKFFTDATDKLQ